MSADHWGDCPKCKRDHAQYIAEIERRILDDYGKITVDEYKRLLNELNNPVEPALTLREDYDIGTDDSGFFEVNYRCHCDRCNFGFAFNHSEQIDLLEKPDA